MVSSARLQLGWYRARLALRKLRWPAAWSRRAVLLAIGLMVVCGLGLTRLAMPSEQHSLLPPSPSPSPSVILTSPIETPELHISKPAVNSSPPVVKPTAVLPPIQPPLPPRPARAEPNYTVHLDYCIVYTRDLATPHGRCFNATTTPSRNNDSRSLFELDPEQDAEELDDDAAEDARLFATSSPSTAPFHTRYPCLPLTLRFTDHAVMENELGVSGEREQLSTVLVLRGEQSVEPIPWSEDVKAQKKAEPDLSDAELKLNFLRQYARLTAPKVSWPAADDPNRVHRERFDTEQAANGGVPRFVEHAPDIERDDLLLFHDRLSWTLFVQSMADTCPFNTRPFGGDFSNGFQPSPNEPDRESKDVCTPHHELLFADMARTAQQRAEGYTPQGDAPGASLRQCSTCDGHATAQYLLVPRQLFRSTVAPLVCKSDVHSLLDVFLGIQDHNEQQLVHERIVAKMQRRTADLAKSYSDPPSAPVTTSPSDDLSTQWNTLGYGGQTSYWNSNKDIHIIDSKLKYVEPTVYVKQELIDHLDKHDGYPSIDEAGEEPLDAESQAAEDDAPVNSLAMIRVMCCTRGDTLALPPRPPLPANSAAFKQRHGSPAFPPPEAGWTEVASSTRFNRSNLKTFLQPQRPRLRGWTKERFEGWVDVQGQGRYVCPTCVLRWDFCRYVSGREVGGTNRTTWPAWEYFSCALGGEIHGWEYTERGKYLEEKGYIGRVDPTPHTALEVPAALHRRGIRRVVYSNEHISWHGCTHSTPLCCTLRNPVYPLACRNPRKDALWVQTAPCCLRHFVSLYHYLVTLFEAHGVEWSLGFGSLLTALRSEGALNPYDYDADFMVYYKGYLQIKALIPQIERDGYVISLNWNSKCKRECELYRVIHQSPDHMHQTTIDIFLQDEPDRPRYPFNDTTTFLYRPARIPHNSVAYLNAHFPGWRDNQVFTVENWLADPVTKVRPPFLHSSLLKLKRDFNRSLEQVTLPAWSKRLHTYAEWDLNHGGIDKRDERQPHVVIVWRPEQMDLK